MAKQKSKLKGIYGFSGNLKQANYFFVFIRRKNYFFFSFCVQKVFYLFRVNRSHVAARIALIEPWSKPVNAKIELCKNVARFCFFFTTASAKIEHFCDRI